MKWLDSVIDLMHFRLSKLQEIVKDREVCVQQPLGSQRVRQDLMTEQRTTFQEGIPGTALYHSKSKTS